MNPHGLDAIDNPLSKFAGCIDDIPIRIGAPSFVFNAGYAENIALLRRVFDEIQLLIFEPIDRSPIDAAELDAIRALKKGSLTYSVHLPIQNHIDDKNEDGPSRRSGALAAQADVKVVTDVIKTFEPIGVENYILHAEILLTDSEPANAVQQISEIVELTGVPVEKLCVENLHTGFERQWKQLERTGVSICFDVGHLLFTGGDPMEFIDRYGDRIRMAHCHGVDGTDHRPLNAMADGLLQKIAQRFIDIKMPGAMIIENHSVDEMVESLRCLCDLSARLRQV